MQEIKEQLGEQEGPKTPIERAMQYTNVTKSKNLTGNYAKCTVTAEKEYSTVTGITRWSGAVSKVICNPIESGNNPRFTMWSSSSYSYSSSGDVLNLWIDGTLHKLIGVWWVPEDYTAYIFFTL